MEKKQPAFNEWLKWVFDHPVAEPAWHWHAEEWLEPPYELAVDYLTKVFEEPNEHLLRFDDAQVNAGLNLLASTSCSSHFFSFLDESVPLEKRLRGVRSFIPLFTGYFASRCSNHLSHIDEAGANPLNAICYMWWDIAPFYGGREGDENARINSVCLEVMKAALATGSLACQESALHGLGHYAIYPPHEEACRRIVDDFLASSKALRPELVNYAKAARIGRVQ